MTSFATTKESIEKYVDYQPTLSKQVFSALLDNKSEATQNTISRVSDTIKKWLNRAGLQTAVNESWMGYIFAEYDIESLMDILRGESLQETKTIAYKIQQATIGGILNQLLGYVLDLDLKNLSYDERMIVGDAMCLACLYREAPSVRSAKQVR